MGAPAAKGTNNLALDTSREALDLKVRQVLTETLALDEDDVAAFDADTGLFGHLPELDLMAVATLLTAMEDVLGIVIEDDDVDAEMLETYGGLLAFAEAKLVTDPAHRDAGGELPQEETGKLDMGGPAELSDRP